MEIPSKSLDTRCRDASSSFGFQVFVRLFYFLNCFPYFQWIIQRIPSIHSSEQCWLSAKGDPVKTLFYHCLLRFLICFQKRVMGFLRCLPSCLLSFIVFMAGSPFQLFLQSKAQETGVTRLDPSIKALTQLEIQAGQQIRELPEQEAREEMEKNITELRASILDPSKSSSMDPFQMVQQRVIDERPQNQKALEEDIRLQDYLERVEFLERDIEALKAISSQQEQKRDEARTQIQRTQANGYIEDAKSRLAFAQSELQDLEKFDPRKGEPLNVDLMIDHRLRTRHYWGDRMRLLIHQRGEVVTEIKQRDFTQSLSPRFSSENPLDDFRGRGEMIFTIADSRGRPMHQFFTPVEAVFFFAEHLIYVESSKLSQEKSLLPIRFIDLNYARVNVGNAPLPVFTLPLKVQEIPENFQMENGFLKIGETLLSHSQFALISKMNQILFNVNVSLVDSATYERAKPLIEQMLGFLGKSMEVQDHLFQQQFEKTIAADPYMRELTQNFEGIKPREHSLRQTTGEISGGGRVGPDSTTGELFVDESLIHSNRALFESRRLMTRIHLLMRFLAQPRPEGAPKIQNALLMLASFDREQRQKSLEFIRDGFSIKLARYGMGAGVAVLGAMTFPEFFQTQMYKSMDLISAVHAHFIGYMEYIDYGRAYASLSKDAFLRVTGGVTYFYDSYITDGRWIRLLQGFGTIFFEILKPLAAIHVAVNSFAAFRGAWRVRSLSQGQLNWMAAFYYESRRATQEYWAEKSADVEKSGGGKLSEIRPEEERILLEYLARLRKKRASTEDLLREIENGKMPEGFFSNPIFKALRDRLPQGRVQGVLLSMVEDQKIAEEELRVEHRKSVDAYHKMISFSQSMGETYQEVAENFPKKRVQAVRRALADTFLSYPSVVRSFKVGL